MLKNILNRLRKDEPKSHASEALSGKYAIVTGASGSIGSKIALALAKQGANLALLYYKNEKSVHEIAKEITHLGRETFVIQVDARERTQVQATVAKIEQRFPRIDILVNNHGIARDGLLVTMKQQDWDDVIETNLSGTFYFCQAVVSGMVKQKSGRIINIASVTGLIPQKLRTNYGTSKRGVIALTRALSFALAGKGILVNAIAPQVIKGGISKDMSFKEAKTIHDMTPLLRFGQPQEVAEVVTFLAGEGASYMTGSVINISGGLATWI